MNLKIPCVICGVLRKRGPQNESHASLVQE